MTKIKPQNSKPSNNKTEDHSLYGNAQRFAEWAEKNAKILIAAFMTIVVVCVLVMALSLYSKSKTKDRFQMAYSIEKEFVKPTQPQPEQQKQEIDLSDEDIAKIQPKVIHFIKTHPESDAARNLAIKWISKLYDQAQYEKALEIISSSSESAKSLDGLSLLLKGSTLMQAGEYPAAIEAFKNILNKKAWAFLHSEASYQMSLAQVKNNDVDAAIASLKSIQEKYPEDTEAISQATKVMRWLEYQKAQKN